MSTGDGPSPAVRELATQRGFSSNVRDGGFEYLLRVWRSTVREVEVGYSALFDEYLNDMDGRKIIDALLPVASESERQKVTTEVRQLDARFFAVTRPVDDCIWGADNARKHGYTRQRDWWYYRVPTDLSRAEYSDQWPS